MPWGARGRQGRDFLLYLPDDVPGTGTIEGRLQGQQLVEKRSQGVDIRALIHLIDLPGGLFGRHVGGSADNGTVHGFHGVGLFGPVGDDQAFLPFVSPAQNPGQPPVHHVDLAEISHHDVGWFQVAVYDSLGVGVGDAVTDLDRGVEQTGQGLSIGLCFVFPGFFYLVCQGGALYHFHGEIDPAF